MRILRRHERPLSPRRAPPDRTFAQFDVDVGAVAIVGIDGVRIVRVEPEGDAARRRCRAWSRGHVALGFATLVAGVAYASICLRAGRRGLYLPWSVSGLRTVGCDLAGLLRGRVPASEGGGLIGFVEGLLLLALVATALTGAGWFLAQGGDAALTWRAQHLIAARALVGLLVLHVVTVSLHLLDFVRD